MEEEMIRVKYRYLQSKLYDIKNRLHDMNNLTEDIKSSLKQSIIIDDKIVEEDLFDSIKNEQQDIYEELVSEILPTVSNRS